MAAGINDVQVRTRAPKGLSASQWRKILREVSQDNGLREWQLITQALMKVPMVASRVRILRKETDGA